MTIWEFPRVYETELRLLNASSSLIQGDCHDPITNTSISPCPLLPVNMPSERELKALEKETEYEVRCPRMMVLSDLFSNSFLFSFPLPLFEIQIFRILYPQYCFSYPNISQCRSLSPPICLSHGRQTDLLETYF